MMLSNPAWLLSVGLSVCLLHHRHRLAVLLAQYLDVL